MNGAVGGGICGQLFPFGYGRFVLSAGREELRLLKNSTSIRGHNNTSTIRTIERSNANSHKDFCLGNGRIRQQALE
jgi:hypothetical protein